VLIGRRAECRELDELIEAIRGGQSRTVVVRGEAGSGKTALLDYLVEQAPEFRVVRVAGVQSEMEVAFAALHQVCAPLLERLDRLPAPQRDALRTTFGLRAGSPPDRLLIGLAVLDLLAEMAEEQPLLCVIDDVQWLDRASVQTLGFVARRLAAESVAMVFAARASRAEQELTGLPELAVSGLPLRAARELLSSVVHVPLDERVADRIVSETRGNPLALLELPRAMTRAELEGGFGLPANIGVPARIEDEYQRRLQQLPRDAQRLLLVAATEPLGDAPLVWRAARSLGIEADAAAPAAEADLCELGASVRFRHPLVRSAVYRAASPEDRRSAHRALAEATDPEADPDRRAWHRAHAAAGPDEAIAAELETSAGRARARGGLAAAAAFLGRAAELTPDPARRGERSLAAAEVEYLAGAHDAALATLALAEAEPLDELGGARVELLRGEIAFALRRGADAPPLLLGAAKRLEPLDVELARDTYLEALSAAMFAGRLGGGIRAAGEAARAAPRPPAQPRPHDLLLDGLAARFTEGYAASAPLLKQALEAFRAATAPRPEESRWLSLACWVAADLWDDEAWAVLSPRLVAIVREAGALSELPIALSTRIYLHLLAGELRPAAGLTEVMEAVIGATASELAPYGALELAALQGREAEAEALIEATIAEVVPRGEGYGMTICELARAQLYNGLRRFDKAVVAARRASEHADDLGASTWAYGELVEAAVRAGEDQLAREALERLVATTAAAGTGWALGVEARSRALLSEPGEAEPLYRQAIERHERTLVRVEAARSHLLYGEWLRRERHRLAAREHLRIAHDRFAAMGCEAFAERAASEVRATGGKAPRQSIETGAELTPQESQIALLASEGLTNAQIGVRLFLSPRTVEYHLRKVFAKLQIGARSELRTVLSRDSSTARLAS
jgi:DNA-binding CsgD family transcriptional regulator